MSGKRIVEGLQQAVGLAPYVQRIHDIEAENARLRKALTEVEQIGLGPDRHASAAWQAQEAHRIARAALAPSPLPSPSPLPALEEKAP